MGAGCGFTIDDLLRSETALRHGLDNDPTEAQELNLVRLLEEFLPQVCSVCGVDGQNVSIHINSGFRSIAVNKLVGGAKNSAHMDGRAVDFVIKGRDLWKSYMDLYHSSIPFDQLIFECNSWIHLGIAKIGDTPRREGLVAERKPNGGFIYYPLGDNE